MMHRSTLTAVTLVLIFAIVIALIVMIMTFRQNPSTPVTPLADEEIAPPITSSPIGGPRPLNEQ